MLKFKIIDKDGNISKQPIAAYNKVIYPNATGVYQVKNKKINTFKI
jgi:hypothetical protein